MQPRRRAWSRCPRQLVQVTGTFVITVQLDVPRYQTSKQNPHQISRVNDVDLETFGWINAARQKRRPAEAHSIHWIAKYKPLGTSK